MPTAVSATPRRALVIRLGHIGDVLVTTPVFTALKQAYPQLRTTALVNQGTEAMVQNSPFVDEVMALRRDHAGRLAELGYQAGLIRCLRSSGFDLAVDLSGGDRGAFLAWISGARLRVGFAPKKPHPRARAFHRLADPRGTDNHLVETMLRPVRLLGIEPQDTRLRLFPGQEARARAQRLMTEHGLAPKSFALVHPTSRWMFKSWTEQGNAAVIGHLLDQGLKVALTCAPAEQETAFTGRVLACLNGRGGVADLAGRVDLPLLAALLEQARLFFGVDSAPMHMAAALGAPTAVLFGPSGERMWGPWQVESEVITSGDACRPCGRDGCEGSKVSRCLLQIAPDAVIAAVDRLLARTA